MKLTEILIVVLIIVLVFGASRLPQLGKALGEGFKELKKGLREADEDEKKAQSKKPARPSGKTVKKPSSKKGRRTSSKK